MNPSVHAFLSPSNTIAAKCPAAAQRQHLVEERIAFLKDMGSFTFDSPQREKYLASLEVNKELAELGTTLHRIYENRLEGNDTIPAGMKEAGIQDPFVEEALENTARHVEEQMSMAEYAGTETKVENLGVNSGGSLDTWYLIRPVLTVRDLKTGRIEVLAESNVQLMRYACGLMDHFGWPDYIERIDMHIDGVHFASTSWSISHAELREWRDGAMLKFMEAGNTLNPTATPGSHCEHCVAKAHCGECQGWVKSGINQFPTDFLESKTSHLEDLFLLLKVAQNMYENVRDELKQRYTAGFAQPTKLRILPGRTYTRFNSQDEQHILDQIELDPDVVLNKPPEVKTPNQLMKLDLSEKVKQLVMSYNFKRNSVKDTLAAFTEAGYRGDMDALLKPTTMKTPTLLKTMFADCPEALGVIETTSKNDLFEALVPFVSMENLVLTRPSLKSAAKVRDAIDSETLNSITNIGQHSPILTQL